MTIRAAREFAAKGVPVLAIAPGLFRKPMAADVPSEMVEAITSDAIFPRRIGEVSPAESAKRRTLPICACP